MSSELRLRRGNQVSHDGFVGGIGEVTYNTDTKALHVHDGTTAGGFAGGGYKAPFGGAQYRSQADKNTESISVKDFGAIGDGTLHTVQEWHTIGAVHYRRFANLAAVQAVYPHVSSSSDSIDFAATQAAINSLVNGGAVLAVDGHYVFTPVNNGAALALPARVTLRGKKSATIFELITDAADLPNTSTNWDFILMSGGTNTFGGVADITFRHTGGRRNNCATIAVRNGASLKEIVGNTFDYTIASAVVIEGDASAPYPTKCLVSQNNISNTVRHGVYLVGATFNKVALNQFTTTALEAVAIRNAPDNDVVENDFFGGSTSLSHAIALAAPPTGSAYQLSRLKITGNRVFDYYAAGFYGQGVGCSLVDSVIAGNTVNLANDVSNISHGFMFYKTSNCVIKDNVVHGGRNRGMVFYGCASNKISGNTVRNVNGGGSETGAITFAAYTDLNGEAFSQFNKISDCTIVDDRGSPLHVYGLQFLTGNNNNTVRNCEITGQTSTPIFSVDGLEIQNVGSEVEKFQWYTVAAIPAGGATTAAVQAAVIGNSYVSIVNTQSYLKSLRVTTRQTVASGTITANLYQNGSFLLAVVLTGNGAVLTKATQFNQDQITFAAGDVLTAFIAGTSVTSGASGIDCTVHAVTAN